MNFIAAHARSFLFLPADRLDRLDKLCIHPGQVATVNALLDASDQQLEWARWVLDVAAAHPAGVFQLEGAMVAAPRLPKPGPLSTPTFD